ncbi:hypothetical protein GCM10023320_40450 [Pseudonocardia adelaidensis]|uniref:Citrate transporter-like domain-containing protein n=1 Tax=Pseudonocardia adelaidensis TaxID=648754 RepID=A0ABP9NMV0_9PSEU
MLVCDGPDERLELPDFHAVAACAIFLWAYVLIATEKWVTGSAAALGAAMLVLALGISDAHSAFFSEDTGIDWNVIFLLLGMMVIVSVMRGTGETRSSTRSRLAGTARAPWSPLATSTARARCCCRGSPSCRDRGPTSGPPDAGRFPCAAGRHRRARSRGGGRSGSRSATPATALRNRLVGERGDAEVDLVLDAGVEALALARRCERHRRRDR